MKKILFTVALMAMAIVAQAQDLKLTMTPFETEENDGFLTVSLENSMEIAGWEMTIYAPEGMEAVDYELSDRYEVNSRKKPYHTVSITRTNDGGYLLMCYAMDVEHNIISGNSGELVTIVFDMTNYQGSDAPDILIRGFSVSAPDGKQYNLGEDISVDIRNSVVTSAGSASEVVYNLQGQRMGALPNKGIYIQNGRKVVRK